MATTTFQPRAGTLTRLGHWLGRSLARGEHKAAGALVARGLTPKAAKTLTWVVKLAVIGGLLFVAFWLALLVGILFIATKSVGDKRDFECAMTQEEEFELRDGNAGIGVYDNDLDIRIS